MNPVEERKSEESLNSIVSSDVCLTPEYKKLRKQYDALCVLFKRCQDVIKLQEKDKQELKEKVTAMETEVTTLKMDMNLHPTVSTSTSTSVKPAILTGVTIFSIILAFVLGFVVGQFATHFVWK